MKRLYLITGLEDLNEEILGHMTETEILITSSNLKTATKELHEMLLPGDVVLVNRYLDSTDDGSEIVQLVKEIRQKEKEIQTIILTAEYERSVVHPLVAQGVYDWIIKTDVSAEDVKWVVDKPAKEFPFELYEKPMIEAAQAATNSTSPLGGFSLFNPRKDRVKSMMKEVITFWSPFSRGATTCAVYYARALADKYHCQVAVVSIDMISPRMESVIGLSGKYKVQDALKALAAGALTTERLQKIMTESTKNIDFLPSSYSYDELYYTDPQNLKRLLELLKGLYDFVVVDVNRYYTDKFTFTALEASDLVLCPITADKVDIELFNGYLREFRMHSDHKVEKFKPLINLYEGKHLSFIEVEQLLGMKALGYIKTGKLDKVMKKTMADLADRR